MISSEPEVKLPPIPADAENRLAKPPPTVTPSMWSILAGLRFVLASVVVFTHMVAVVDITTHPLVNAISTLDGASCVWGFFIISGFSIAASIERDAKQFYMRRINRIYPVLLACVALCAVPFVITKSLTYHILAGTVEFPDPFTQIIPTCLGLPFIIDSAVLGVGPTWTLVCDILYYSVTPLLQKLNYKWLVGLGLLSYIGYKIYAGPYHGIHIAIHGVAPAFLFWIWLTGFAYYKWRTTKYADVCLVSAMLLIGSDTRPQYPNCEWILLLVAAVFILGKNVELPEKTRKWLNYLGDVSYPLYLVHPNTMFTLSVISTKIVNNCFLMYGICVLMAIAILHLIDYPSRQRAKAQAIKSAPISNSPTTNEFACIR